MIALLLCLAAWLVQPAVSDSSFRGLKALPNGTVWVSGTKGGYLLNNRAATVPGAEALDFRGVEAFDAATAWMMSSGEGEKSRVYRTSDAGKTWTLQFTNPDAKGFFDGIRFWDANHGIILGDPVNGRFTIFTTSDGGITWVRQTTPPALSDEGAFAASNTSLALTGKSEVWFGTGGPGGARVFHSTDRGVTWKVSATPLRNNAKTAGIFSLVFLNPRYGVAVGGDYAQPNDSTGNIAITTDGGNTWTEPPARPSGYRSGIAFDAKSKTLIATGPTGSDKSRDNGRTWTALDTTGYNAVAFAGGVGWAAGPKGRVAKYSAR